MRIIRHTDKNFSSAMKKLDRRSAPPAGVEEIARVEGVSDALAERIYATLHGLDAPGTP